MQAELTHQAYPFLQALGVGADNLGCYRDGEWVGNGNSVTSLNPHNNKPIANVKLASIDDYNSCIAAMKKEKARWMSMPAPQRGEIVRQIGDKLR
jgi:aldehyde dehydrogenase family 7 member A1